MCDTSHVAFSHNSSQLVFSCNTLAGRESKSIHWPGGNPSLLGLPHFCWNPRIFLVAFSCCFIIYCMCLDSHSLLCFPAWPMCLFPKARQLLDVRSMWGFLKWDYRPCLFPCCFHVVSMFDKFWWTFWMMQQVPLWQNRHLHVSWTPWSSMTWIHVGHSVVIRCNY